MRRALWIVLVLLASAGPASAGGAFLPPIELEVGRASTETAAGVAPTTQLMVGLSWASLYPYRTPVDFSVGWLESFGPAIVPAPSARMTETVGDDEHLHGVFLAGEVRAHEGRHWRTWIGVRGELLDAGEVGVLGAFGRVSTELWSPAVVGGRGGGIYGTVALTAWAELGVRERADQTLSSVVAAGLGVRLPLVAASN